MRPFNLRLSKRPNPNDPIEGVQWADGTITICWRGGYYTTHASLAHLAAEQSVMGGGLRLDWLPTSGAKS